MIEEVGHEGSRAFGPGLKGKHRGSFQSKRFAGALAA